MTVLQKILNSAKREMRRMVSRPLYLISSVAVMAITCVFYITLMQAGAPEKMPVVVIDNDASTISRRLVHELQATPAVNVVKVVDCYEQARDMMQRGQIYGFIEIPANFYADLSAQRQPKVNFYVSYAYTMGGTTAYKQLLTLTNLINGAFLQQVLKLKGQSEYHIMDLVQPVKIEGHMLYNPWGNYPTYLLTTLFPGTLGVIVLMLVIYAIGVELKEETTHAWLKASHYNYHCAMAGKLLPYTILFWGLGLGFMAVMYEWMNFPLNGHHIALVLNLLMFIIAMECFAVILIGLLPVLRDALSAGALLGMMSFTMSGFTFPNMGMLPIVRGISYLFPLRHHYLVYVQQALLDAPMSQVLPTFLNYFLFMVGAWAVSKRLKDAMIRLQYPKK